MSEAKKPSVVQAVVLAGAFTLIVTLLRLLGELQGWDPRFFSREPGGQGAIIGIGWLMVPVSFWLGRRCAASGGRPRLGRGFLIAALAIGGFVGGTALVANLYPKDFMTMVKWFSWGTPLLALLTLFAWPRAFVANLAYAVLARAPVIAIQYVGIARDWGTHFEKVAPQAGEQPPEVRAQMLLFAQAFFWTPATVLIGSLFALLGALTVRQRD